jgi:uncharacterized membrane protein
MELRRVIALLIVILVCFVAGLLARTGPGLRAKNAIERSIFEHIPGYSLIRGLTARIAGAQEDQTFATALVELEDAFVPAFVVEEHEDGAYTVFVPSAPTPAAGTVYILPKERVHLVDASFMKAARVISKWGEGAHELRAAMKEAAPLPGKDQRQVGIVDSSGALSMSLLHPAQAMSLHPHRRGPWSRPLPWTAALFSVRKMRATASSREPFLPTTR